MLAAALPFLAAGCVADTAGADEGFTEWQNVEFSEETQNREEYESAFESELATESEKTAEILKEYERRLAAAGEEEARLVAKLADIRGTEALTELSEELRAVYGALAAETEEELAALRDEESRIREDAERIRALNGPPEEEFEEFEEIDEYEEYER
jgi:hypothetical protein